MMCSINGYETADYDDVRWSLKDSDRIPVFTETVVPGIRPLFWGGAAPDGALENFFHPQLFIPRIDIDVWRDVTVAGAGVMFTSDRRVLYGHVPVGGVASQFLQPWSDLNLAALGNDQYFCASLSSEETIDMAVLLARASPGNYHHFLIDILPRALLVQEAIRRRAQTGAHPDLDGAKFLLNADVPPWALRMLEAVGISEDQCVRIPTGGALRVGKLFVPHLLNNFAYWVSPELHRLVAPTIDWANSLTSKNAPNRRIFSLRREMANDRRAIVNNADVATTLMDQGFQELALERMDWASQIRAFVQADYIVASMGSNISNMIFCKPGARLLIIHPEDSVYSLNVGMAAAGGQDIGYVWADCFSNKRRGEHAEMYLDSRLFESALTALLSGSVAGA